MGFGGVTRHGPSDIMHLYVAAAPPTPSAHSRCVCAALTPHATHVHPCSYAEWEQRLAEREAALNSRVAIARRDAEAAQEARAKAAADAEDEAAARNGTIDARAKAVAEAEAAVANREADVAAREAAAAGAEARLAKREAAVAALEEGLEARRVAVAKREEEAGAAEARARAAAAAASAKQEEAEARAREVETAAAERGAAINREMDELRRQQVRRSVVRVACALRVVDVAQA